MRLNKYIADAGVCSRRKADEMIKEGRVKRLRWEWIYLLMMW